MRRCYVHWDTNKFSELSRSPLALILQYMLVLDVELGMTVVRYFHPAFQKYRKIKPFRITVIKQGEGRNSGKRLIQSQFMV